MERFIGYIVSFLVLAGMGLGLPQWFAWRRSLVDRWPGERKDAEHPESGRKRSLLSGPPLAEALIDCNAGVAMTTNPSRGT